jgi:uncharacterized protein
MWRKQVIAAIGAVQREYRVADVATFRLAEEARRDPILLRAATIEFSDLRSCRRHLEATYLARMVAVFEAHLRDVWAVALGNATHPKMRDLLDGCAAREAVPYDLLAQAHAVRDYRNYVVHGTHAAYVSLDDSRAHLCAFFGRMPISWG